MKKGTEHFKNTIQTNLEEMADDDPLFAKSLEKEDKDLDGCVNYILQQVREIGAQGYTDDEIYGMAAHYYDEDDLEASDLIECGVVVNHKPPLTEKETKELKEQARKEVFNEERARLYDKKSKITKSKENKEPTLF
jgi:hypothetical protein